MPRLRCPPSSRATRTAPLMTGRRSSANHEGDSMQRVSSIARAAGAMLTLSTAVLLVAGCAAPAAPEQQNVDAKADEVLKSSFVERGQAKLDRLDQDETQRLCTQAGTKMPPKDVAEKIEKLNLAAIPWPADGKYLGDWK